MTDSIVDLVREHLLRLVNPDNKDMEQRPSDYEEGRIWFQYFHIERVYDIGVPLAQEFGADVEVVELAALLHDYTQLFRGYSREMDHPVHAETSAEKATKLLVKLGYKGNLELVNTSIREHRSTTRFRDSVESRILASADAVDSLNMRKRFYIDYENTFEPEKRGELIASTHRRWNKIMPEIRERYRKTYDLLIRYFSAV